MNENSASGENASREERLRRLQRSPLVPGAEAPPPPRKRRGASVVWGVLIVLVLVRFVIFRQWFTEGTHEWRRMQQVGFDGGGQQFGGQRWGRPATRVNPAVSEVPKDLPRLEIEISAKDENLLRGAGWGRGRDAAERPEVTVKVREGGSVYTNVSLHLKGSAGSFRSYDDKPAMTLNFSKNAKGQKFHGYSKISLNNSVQDRSLLCEAISRELFNEAGVPAPVASHATVVVNKRDLGLYVMLEGYGKPFLKRHFTDVSGNLYDGGFCQEISTGLDTNSGDHPDDRTDLQRLMKAALQTDPAVRWQQLTNILDMDRFITFMAMEIITCHWDGYCQNRNNYRVFHDAEKDKMVFMPHGMDQMYGRFRSHPKSPIAPGMQGMVARAVMTTAPGSSLYRMKVAELRTNVFVPEKIVVRVKDMAVKIRPTVAAYGQDALNEFEGEVESLMQRIAERAASVSEQLGPPREPMKFNEQGIARVGDWRPSRSGQRPGMNFTNAEKDGRAVLMMTTGRGGSAGSWRTRVQLPHGLYTFRGKAMLKGVGGAGGVCLRLSGSQAPMEKLTDGSWTTLERVIQVDPQYMDVELVCEFIADRGEAWFDPASLELERQ